MLVTRIIALSTGFTLVWAGAEFRSFLIDLLPERLSTFRPVDSPCTSTLTFNTVTKLAKINLSRRACFPGLLSPRSLTLKTTGVYGRASVLRSVPYLLLSCCMDINHPLDSQLDPYFQSIPQPVTVNKKKCKAPPTLYCRYTKLIMLRPG